MMLYMSAVMFGAMFFCMTTGCLLKRRELSKITEVQDLKLRDARVAFENDDDKFTAAQ